jgi:general secretion pathway protein M
MTPKPWTKISAMRRTGAVAAYAGLIVLFLVIIATTLSVIASRRANVAAEEAMLAQLEGRSPLGRKGDAHLGAPGGSPFLQGQTVNVAGAALLQRIAAAVTRVGGKILSSQVDLQKTDAKDGWIGLVISCEIEQQSLQTLLYDVEAGMPFLFIDQLVVDSPETGNAGNNVSRLKVVLGVSGQWLGRK